MSQGDKNVSMFLAKKKMLNAETFRTALKAVENNSKIMGSKICDFSKNKNVT